MAVQVQHHAHVDFERPIGFVHHFYPALKFTWEISETCLFFLEILVYFHNDALAMSASHKPTDFHVIVLPTKPHQVIYPHAQVVHLHCVSDHVSYFPYLQG